MNLDRYCCNESRIIIIEDKFQNTMMSGFCWSFADNFVAAREVSVSANESETVLTTDESGLSNSSQNPTVSNTSPLAGIMYGVFKPRQDIIPRMLASKNSLLNMCLRRGKNSQAEQVVKVMYR